MNLVDILIFVLIIFTVLRGVEIGLIRQASSLIGLIGGVWIGSMVASWFDVSTPMHIGLVIAIMVLIIIVSEIVGVRVKLRVAATQINHIDKSLGGAMGVVTCLVLVWLGSTLVSGIPVIGLQQGVRDSKVIAWLDGTMPPATDVLSTLERSFVDTGLPGLLGVEEPALQPNDATLPALTDFDAVIAQSRDSIVELEGRSCQGLGVGSGFVVADDMIVTNAHVVAGMLTPYVKDANGRHTARVVAFDTNLDIAVLRVDGLAGEPLTVSDERHDVGTAGVALGYPGGGPFDARPARIVDIFTAVGPDVYNETTSERDVYALRADIRPGNSGGPVLDEDGTVIAVIFARSTSYEGVGYAVTTPQVRSLITQAQESPSAGTSQRCLPS